MSAQTHWGLSGGTLCGSPKGFLWEIWPHTLHICESLGDGCTWNENPETSWSCILFHTLYKNKLNHHGCSSCDGQNLIVTWNGFHRYGKIYFLFHVPFFDDWLCHDSLSWRSRRTCSWILPHYEASSCGRDNFVLTPVWLHICDNLVAQESVSSHRPWAHGICASLWCVWQH